MRIQQNIPAMNAHRQLGNNTNAVGKNIEKLSSGFRINRAADDAAGLAISEKMRAQIKGLDRAKDNANDAISLIQTAEGALTEVHSMLNRMVELGTQAANGTYTGTDLSNIQAEVTSLVAEIDRIATNTTFNGISLLTGGGTINLQIGDTAAQTLGVTATASGSAALTLGGVAASIGSGGATASSTIETIRTAINTVSATRAGFGAMQNRLEHTVNNLGVTSENMSAAEARIRDTDMAKEMMSFTKNNILTQASQAMLAQANTQPQGVLQLLQ